MQAESLLNGDWSADRTTYTYWADETRSSWTVTAEDMAELDRRLETDPNAYSLWCAECSGEEVGGPGPAMVWDV